MDLYLLWIIQTWQGHLLLISILHFLCWGFTLTLKGFVSDDIEGVAKFSDRWYQEKDQLGNVIKEEKIDYYEMEFKDSNGKPYKKKYGNFSFPGFIEFPGCLLRWFRVNWGKHFQKIGTNVKGHAVYGYQQDGRKHHALNLLVQWADLLLAYNLLATIFSPSIALLAVSLFSVYPCGVQTVAWISGVNYLFCLFGALLTFNLALFIENPYILLPLVAITCGFSCLTLLPGCFNWIILIWMGKYDAALIAGLIAMVVFLKQGREVIDYRLKAFKEQHMENFTKIGFHKLVVMVKTAGYYCRFIPFPKRLGLFHTWLYHWDEPAEHINKDFWFGLLCLGLFGYFVVVSIPSIQLVLLWTFIYLLTFSNFVTAQQVVSERYAFIPTLGFCLIIATLLQDYPIIFSFILGIAIMRVWVHLPTFRNEVRFYESNWFNFPESEVAMGNLGVAYVNHGLPNKGLDTWLEASRQNPTYDVPWYNLYSICKENGDFLGARRFLKLCLDSKTVHFSEQWQRELRELDTILEKSISPQELGTRLNKALTEAGYERAGAF